MLTIAGGIILGGIGLWLLAVVGMFSFAALTDDGKDMSGCAWLAILAIAGVLYWVFF
jgi:hypothetical protein